MIQFLKNVFHLFKPQYRLIKQVSAKKQEHKKSGFVYQGHSKLALIIQSFNHRSNIKPIIENLRKARACEIIVCEDGSVDGSQEEWMKYLNRPNDFLIHSNDLHEIRTYDRAVRMARAEIVCLLQDDDISTGCEWIDHALQLFDQHPKLGVLGGYRGHDFDSETISSKRPFGFQGSRADVRPIPFRDPKLGIPFMFVSSVNIGPTFFRKEAWESIGGFDFSYSEPGSPGIIFDDEISFRAWMGGWQVGLYSTSFERGVGGRGTMMFCKAERETNEIKNLGKLKASYGTQLQMINELVAKANQTLKREPVLQT